jgi:hypothetical protein
VKRVQLRALSTRGRSELFRIAIISKKNEIMEPMRRSELERKKIPTRYLVSMEVLDNWQLIKLRDKMELLLFHN